MGSIFKDAASDRMFEGRIRDLVSGSEYTIKTSVFLSPAEQKAAFEIACREGAGSRCLFWGGVPEAERRIAVFVPEWMTGYCEALAGAFDPRREEAVREIIADGADGGEVTDCIAVVSVEGSAYADLSHRDYLGAVTALGLERDSLGDIAVTGPSSAYIFALRAASSLITSSLTSVGREKVSASGAVLPEGFRIERDFETISDTVMSLRLDGIVRALCGISREDASELVERGDVSLNYSVTTKTDCKIEKGDIISVKGHGRFIFDGDRGVNRRGRLRKIYLICLTCKRKGIVWTEITQLYLLKSLSEDTARQRSMNLSRRRQKTLTR